MPLNDDPRAHSPKIGDRLRAWRDNAENHYATTGQLPNKDWSVKPDGTLGYSRHDPMTAMQKLFVTGLGTFAGAGATAGLGALTGAMGSGGGAAAATGSAAASGAGGGSMAGGGWLGLLKNPELWGNVAQVAGNAAAGRQSDRMVQGQQTAQDNLANLNQFTAAQNAQNQGGQLDLQRKMFSEQARGGRGKQALIGDLLANMQDVNISVPGVQNATVTGGMRPSAMSASGRGAASELHKQALMALMNGDEFKGGEILTPPTMQQGPEKGGVESSLDWLGLLGSLGGAFGQSQAPTTHSQLPSSTQQPRSVLDNQRKVSF